MSSPHTVLAETLASRYATFPAVTAVALGGSLSAGNASPGSDIDLYVYLTGPLGLDERREVMASRPVGPAELGNEFWEPGDEWVDQTTGICVDVMFRSTGWIEDRIAAVLDRHEAGLGYTTCFWHNVLTSQVFFDRGGWFAALQERARVEYPEPLRQAIVRKNWAVMRPNLSSYEVQIGKALGRSDWISVNHRLAALLASAFDILFALNRVPHPGEKRLLELAGRLCPERPAGFEAGVRALLSGAAGPPGELVSSLSLFLDEFEALVAPFRE